MSLTVSFIFSGILQFFFCGCLLSFLGNSLEEGRKT